jgi:hypothetical protein
MRHSNLFLIESERSRHRLTLDWQKISTFGTLEEAEAEAARIAARTIPGATLRFELDFKWTLSDLEIRAATLSCAESPETQPTTDTLRAAAGEKFSVLGWFAWRAVR